MPCINPPKAATPLTNIESNKQVTARRCYARNPSKWFARPIQRHDTLVATDKFDQPTGRKDYDRSFRGGNANKSFSFVH